MKKSIILINILFLPAFADGFINLPKGEDISNNNADITGTSEALNKSRALTINNNLNITLKNNAKNNAIVYTPITFNNATFVTNSFLNKDYHLHFYDKITLNSGNFIDYGSTFIGKGGIIISPFQDIDNEYAIELQGGKAKLYNSYLENGQATPGGYGGYKAASAINIKKGELHLISSTIKANKQGDSFSAPLTSVTFGYDKSKITLTSTNIISNSSAGAISSNDEVIIDDTIFDTEWANISNKPINNGTHIIGTINSKNLTIKGITNKDFIALNNINLLKNTYNDPNTKNDTPFKTWIYTTASNIENSENINIDKVYLIGNLSSNIKALGNKKFDINNSFITGNIINSKEIDILNSKGVTDIKINNSLIGGKVTNEYGGIYTTKSYLNNYLEAKGLNNNLTDFDSSVFKNGFKAKDINLTNSTLLNSINNYEGNSFVLNGAKLGEKYDNKANVIINNGYLKATNSLINMGIKSSNNINIELVGTTLIGNTYDLNNNKKIINNLTANNSRILGAFSVNNLNVSNSTFYLSNNNYDGAIISKISTSGIDNNFGILTALTKDSNGTYKVNNLNSNLPLAILKVGNGNANINSFIKDLKFYSGISEFALANSYLSKKEIINGNDRYLVYALTNNKNINFDDLEFNSKKLDISAINNLITDTSKINEYADIKDTIKTSIEANQLSNETTNKDKSQNNIGILVANFDNKSIPWIDLKPANPIKPTTPPNIEDTKPSEPEIKPDIKPEVTPETPINPNENIKPNPNEEAKPEIKPSIPWIDLKPANPIKPSEPKTDEEKFEIALEEQKEAIKLMVTGKNEKALESAKLMTSQFYFSQVFEYNNLNKRLGELRSFTNNNAGIWIRGYINKGSIKNTSIKANEIQLGADKIINNNDFDTYAGIMLNIGKTTTDNTTNSKINNYGFGVYVSNVYNNGFFLDATLKTNHYKSEFKNDTFLGNSTSKGTGIIASAELGYRFGDEFYLEPSLELIANYIPKTDIKGEKVIQFGNLSQVSNVNITSSSKVLMVSKAAVYTGVDINNTTLRAGIGGIFDLTNNPDFLVSDGISSFAFSGAKKDKRGFASIGLNKNISKKLGLNIEAEKTFSGNLNIDYNINASIRFEF